MSAIIDRPAILKLSVEERLKLIELIWETLAGPLEDQFSPELLAELDRRSAEARAHPERCFSMDEFEARLRALRP